MRVQDKKHDHFEFKHRLCDGSIKDVEVWSSSFEVNGRQLLHSIIHDITDRKQTEQELNMLKATIDVASDAAYWMDSEGHFVYANTSGCTMLGYTCEELLKLSVYEVNAHLTYEKWSSMWNTIRTHKKYTAESTHRRKDGSEFPVEIASTYFIYGGKEYVNGFARDISLRKQTEAELIKAQKLESLGLLAGGIAHDFNNLLGGIFGFIDLAAEETKDNTVLNYLTKTLAAIERARSLTGQLLTFSKGGVPLKKICKLSPFIEETTTFALSGSNIQCEFFIPDNLWLCDFDKNQIGQVIDNLVINAKQAMSDGGVITVACNNLTVPTDQHPSLKAGRFVKISIKDQGTGMSKEILSKIFDPFFTTKKSGNGLGLATCFSIIKQHDGLIEVESELGQGSTFHVFLPAATGDNSPDQLITQKSFTGNGLFLVMDDQEYILNICHDILESVGFNVVCVENGQKAVDFILKEMAAGKTLAGALLDITVPGGMGGITVAKELRANRCTIPLFATSGHTEELVIVKPQAFGFTASIKKPFKKIELIELLRKYL